MIEISDNGSGISRENQKKIFEPFFTTKGQGRGTGLGLAIVHEIIQDYNGQIEVDSEIGQRHHFQDPAPRFRAADRSTAAAQEEPEPAAPLEGLVLLIDDEEVVREIGSDMLKTLGLKCLTAANGTEGIEMFKKNSAEIKLVILDIEMPGISGEKVFHILQGAPPGDQDPDRQRLRQGIPGNGDLQGQDQPFHPQAVQDRTVVLPGHQADRRQRCLRTCSSASPASAWPGRPPPSPPCGAGPEIYIRAE